MRSLKAQLCGLERRTARGGRDSVDHAPRQHDDVANAVMGAVLLAHARQSVAVDFSAVNAGLTKEAAFRSPDYAGG